MDVGGDGVQQGGGHLAGDKPLPDQFVEFVLITGQAAFDLVRGEAGHGGPDGLMAVLGAGLGFVHPLGLGQVGLAVLLFNEGGRVLHRFVGKAQGVGSHIGDEAHGAHPLHFHAFIELLGGFHGPPRLEAQFAGSLLLEGGGDKRRSRGFLADPLLHRAHLELHPLEGGQDGISGLLVLDLLFFAPMAVVFGGERLAAALSEQAGIDGPVFL